MAHTFERLPVDAVLRVLDVALATGLLVLTAPLQARCALAVCLSGNRSVLYRGPRVGQGGRVFTMVKFRTLRPDAEARLGPTSATS